MTNKISLAVVDDQQMFRRGIISLIDEFPGIKVAFEAANGQELLDKMQERVLPVDVVLLDIEMPVMDGIEATIKLKRKYPNTKIIILTMHDDEEMIVHLIEKGAHGFLPKNEDFERVIDAIYAVTESGYYFNDKVSKAMVVGLMQNNKITPQFSSIELSEKETEILILLSKDLSFKEIGDKLQLSVKTITNCKAELVKKIGVRGTAGLVMYAIKKGLIS